MQCLNFHTLGSFSSFWQLKFSPKTGCHFVVVVVVVVLVVFLVVVVVVVVVIIVVVDVVVVVFVVVVVVVVFVFVVVLVVFVVIFVAVAVVVVVCIRTKMHQREQPILENSPLNVISLNWFTWFALQLTPGKQNTQKFA